MPAYDARWFDPPAPLAHVALRNPNTGDRLADVPMLIDSGADASLIPRSSVQHLGLELIPETSYELMAFDGSRSFAPVVWTEMTFLKRTFRGRFLVLDQEWGILGRDILNFVSIQLNGPGLAWDEQA